MDLASGIMRGGAVLTAFVLSAPTSLLAAEKTHAPWELIAAQFGGATRRVLHVGATGDPPALYVGGDVGGGFRSLDCGNTWEPVNGGPAVTDGFAGGYPNVLDDAVVPAGGPGCDCDVTTASCDVPAICHHGIVVGRPPSVTSDIDVRALNWGPAPAGVAGLTPGAPMLFRASASLHFSSDKGTNWFTLPPWCVSTDVNVQLAAVASDPGKPEAMIVAAGEVLENRTNLMEASSCPQPGSNQDPPNPNPQTCGVRQIAWSTDVRPQMNVSLAFSQSAHVNTTRRLDTASTWRYASLNHLASSNKAALPTACIPTGPAADCGKDVSRFCRGIKGVDAGVPVESACLDAEFAQCKCDDDADCKYPIVTGLTYDPRNGWVYASTQSGLLMSIDGGRSWGRRGPADAASALADPIPALLPAGPGSTYAVAPGVIVATGVQTGVPADDQAADVTSLSPNSPFETPAVDLNRIPWRISHIGRMSLVFQEEACPTTGDTVYANGRKRGRLTAYLPVSWFVMEDDVQVKRSSTFVAFAGPCKDPGQKLWFRDVNTSVYIQPDEPCLALETKEALRLPKLPRTQQYDAYSCYDPGGSLKRCRLEVVAVAAAPSHPNIAYTLLRPFNRKLHDVEADHCAAGKAAASNCSYMSGVYQTLNGGATWGLVHNHTSPQSASAAWDFNDLTVFARNP